MTIDTIRLVAEIAGWVTCIAAAFALIIGIIRKFHNIIDAFKCILRSSMLNTYYKNADSETIRQYELQNFELSYKAYKALHGNSFVDDIREVVVTWKVIT